MIWRRPEREDRTMRTTRRALALAIGLLTATTLAAFETARAETTTLHIVWYSDGNEDEVMQDLLHRFEGQNSDIHVSFDQVPFQAINQNLPMQVAAGQGPDIARIVDTGGIAPYALDLRPLLKDPATFENDYAASLPWLRVPGDTSSLPGFITQITMTGPFVNKTLFEQAGVAMPGASATWDHCAKTVKDVAEKE
jgi:alpha-1,4-digalacturonate transport system substrate-binding protein